MSKEDLIKKCDGLCDDYKYQEEHEILQQLVKDHPNDVEVLWRVSRSFFSLAEEKPKDKAFQKQQIEKGLEYAQKAIEANPNHWGGYKWVAILLGNLGDFIEIKEKIKNSYVIKEKALKAAEINPKDANTQHLLGRWCFNVVNIGMIERTAASALFGTPPTSTWEEALGFFLKCEELSDYPNIRNRLFLGDTYLGMKNKDKAKEWFQKAIDSPAKNATEQALQEEAKTKLKKVNSSWW